ncbi:MAG: TadE/TadG family type IV pilus assembly protein [Rothia sp. (in: high G+C Gram-positive bacteria)]|uniref:TadE/TadG family type IV pilus assembly protein n=1 Tax=Rothia sp. (in: high G+C Gram-positive bacteria) TaxID=1885016 RepID=UPI0026DEBA42|nr:TadE/TadG family type IV pilus assembly protein [Rothia sp. (in: high G+C Gram-positive bacteria)]MDO5750136.1 TadE/TadG family type IV pilus assembly protein [Rothia sp. (in: high G+C Gram-positive bacteria)]
MFALPSTPQPASYPSEDHERGDASTDFVMVSVLLIALVGIILQLSYALYTRNIVLDAANAGARYGALYDRSPDEGAERTRAIIAGALPASYASNISYSVEYRQGTRVLAMEVRAPLPVLGPLGLPDSTTVRTYAIYPEYSQGKNGKNASAINAPSNSATPQLDSSLPEGGEK